MQAFESEPLISSNPCCQAIYLPDAMSHNSTSEPLHPLRQNGELDWWHEIFDRSLPYDIRIDKLFLYFEKKLEQAESKVSVLQDRLCFLEQVTDFHKKDLKVLWTDWQQRYRGESTNPKDHIHLIVGLSSDGLAHREPDTSRNRRAVTLLPNTEPPRLDVSMSRNSPWKDLPPWPRNPLPDPSEPPETDDEVPDQRQTMSAEDTYMPEFVVSSTSSGSRVPALEDLNRSYFESGPKRKKF